MWRRELEISKSMETIIVIGGGGHARVVIGILRKLNSYVIQGYTDLRNCGELQGARYLGDDDSISGLLSTSRPNAAVLAVGQVGLGKKRYDIWRGLDRHLVFPAIVSPDAIVNDEVVVSDGVVVMDGAIVNPGARLGRGVIANTHSTIEHDVMLGDWVHVASGATIAGGVEIGAFSMVGAGATVIEGKSIPAETIVGAGATVVDDLTEPGVYIGTPARRIR